MSAPTPEAARAWVERRMREDHPHGSFPYDRLPDALAEAEEWGDDWVCVKIPSGSEFDLPIAYARVLVGGRR